MRSPFFRMWPLLLLLAVVDASAKDNAGPRVYSDVRHEEGGTDMVGTELELNISGNSATGVLKIYYGGCAEHVPVTGTSSGNTIQISGEGQGYGKMEITANFRHGGLDGSLRLERNHTSEKIRLKKIKKAHC
jgi:hypothetical protein